jgi:glycosyltransferase involved in cell wall biosynthesis
MVLGKKRNEMHSKCKGDIIIYLDDDDYYPPERVSHAVETLEKNPSFLIAGSSELHIYFKHINKLFQFGPYAPYHSTAASFAFRKQLLLQTSYDETKALAEEIHFLKKYSIPLIQLDIKKTILVFSHCHNTFDKKKLLETPLESKITDSPYNINDFMKKDEECKQFYLKDIEPLLESYEPGSLKHKPEVIKQISKIEEDRKRMKEEHNKQQMEQNNLVQKEFARIKEHYEKRLDEKGRLISEIMKKLKEAKDVNTLLTEKIALLEKDKEDKDKEDKDKEDKEKQDKDKEDKE